VKPILKEVLIIAINGGLLIGLSVDILYLYFAGGWREPILPILWLELAMLGLTPVFAVWLTVRSARALATKLDEEVEP
jgi:hypothetical protein